MEKRKFKFRIFQIIILWLAISVQISEMSGQINARKEINIPNIPKYLTLKCDFHMHTVFSDGVVWPTVRVEEAWREGLDAIAITEHIENQPSKEEIKGDHNRSYEIALPRAKALGIILIRAGEITRSMPPGHFNAFFLKDVNLLDVKDWRDAIKAAVDQDAFIEWNHPGWRQPNEIPIWYPEHDEIYKNGWMHGMEIVNERSYYPLAQTWCLEKGITMMGNSDIHAPANLFFDFSGGEHRAMTLVFATEKSEEAIKEAMFKGRTAVYYNHMLFGQTKYLLPVFNHSVKLDRTELAITGKQRVYLQIHNSSDIPFELNAISDLPEISFPKQLTLHANQTSLVELRGKQESLSATIPITLNYEVKNLKITAEKGLPIAINVTVHFQEAKQ